MKQVVGNIYEVSIETIDLEMQELGIDDLKETSLFLDLSKVNGMFSVDEDQLTIYFDGYSMAINEDPEEFKNIWLSIKQKEYLRKYGNS